MKLNRRNFFKNSILSLAALPFVSKATGIFQTAEAKDAPSDSKIKKQGYVHNYAELDKMEASAPKKYKKYKKYIGAKKDGFQPKCANCKFYKKAEGDWASCSMVGATKKPGKWVYKDGMCKVYNRNKKSKA